LAGKPAEQLLVFCQARHVLIFRLIGLAVIKLLRNDHFRVAIPSLDRIIAIRAHGIPHQGPPFKPLLN
jgi:hypothetical protein